jgi:hypothetical protein
VGYPQGNIPMANGFGGALAAPIWHDYMLAASSGFCGDFPQPTTPWTGTAFVGPHSGGRPNSSNNNGNGPGSGNGAGSGSGGAAPQNPYNNPTLFAQPTTPNSGGTAPSGGGNGGGHGGGQTGGGVGGAPGPGGGHAGGGTSPGHSGGGGGNNH